MSGAAFLDLTVRTPRERLTPIQLGILVSILPRLSRGAMSVLCRIAYRYYRKGVCHATNEQIAASLGITKSTIQPYMDELENFGILIIIRGRYTAEGRTSNLKYIADGVLDALNVMRLEKAVKRRPFSYKNRTKATPKRPRIASISLASLANARACAPAREACLLEEEKNDEVIPITPPVCDQPSNNLPTSNQANDVALGSGALASLVCKDVYSDELDKQPIEIPASGAQRSPKPIAGCARSARTQTLPARPPVSPALPISQELVAQLRALPMAWHGIRDLAAMPDAESRIRQTFAIGKHLEPGTKNPAGVFRAACLGNWASEKPLPGSEQAAAVKRERQHDRPQPGTVAHTQAKASYEQRERIEVERRRAEAERVREWRETPEGRAEAERGLSILRETMDRLAGRSSHPTRPPPRTAPSWIGAG